MEFFRRAAGNPRRVAVFPGTFNPPTRAHLGLAEAALAEVDELVFVLPRVLPHKQWSGAPFEDRLAMLERAAGAGPRFSIAASERGLFIEIARECREAYGPDVELWFVSGRDAAERIVTWDYGRPWAIEEQLREYGLLVAPRAGPYVPPEALSSRIRALTVAADYDSFSATDVRNRIRAGQPWEHLVPAPIVDMVRRLYKDSS